MECVRSITFVIPGLYGSPDVEVMAVENDGSIEFTVTVLETDGIIGDLRGLFFDVSDDAKLAGLMVSGDDVTDQDTGSVIDLGKGANMRGVANPSDVGIEFGYEGIGKNKGDIQQTTFTLTNTAGDLTLDDIAQVYFGARITSIGESGGKRQGSSKQVTISPAAPDAVDDDYEIFEDNAAGLDDPQDISSSVLLDVLENDTDADGDTLTITHVFGAMHGTVEIVDGDDADSDPGDAILYTPDTDYAGPEEFTYCISDNNGGMDFATVTINVVAVADLPTISIEAFAGNSINEIRLVVTAEQTDDDVSEYIDNIVNSALPAGVTLVPMGPVDPAGTPSMIVQEYLLTLPADQDTSAFELTFTTTAVETSNGDTETNSAAIIIESDFETNGTTIAFEADDQSIWDEGDAFTFGTGKQFLGVDEDDSGTWAFIDDDFVGGTWGYDVRIGFEQEFNFGGGSIDATIPYDVNIDYFYNKTLDTLELSPLVSLADGGGFLTDGPYVDYVLDFIFQVYLESSVEIFGEVDLSPPAVDIDWTPNIIDYNSQTDGPVNLGDEDNAFSGTLQWPELDVMDENLIGDVYSGDGESNDVLSFNVDADQLVSNILLGGANPFDPPAVGAYNETLNTGALLDIELLDVDLFAGTNFAQAFALDAGDVLADIVFESGDTFQFDLASPTQYTDASQYDLNGDGVIEFDLEFSMAGAQLTNDTDLQVSVGADLDALELRVAAGILGFGIDETFGPLLNPDPASADIASFDVYDNTFELALLGDQFDFFG